MANPKLTGFLISMIIIGLISGLATYYLTGLNVSYELSNNNRTLENYTKSTNEIITLSEQIKNSTSIDASSSWVDILGGYFSAGYKSLKLSFVSFSTFENLATISLEKSNLAGVSGIIKSAIFAIVIILFFVGIIIAILVKKDDL